MSGPARVITRHERTYVGRHYNTVKQPYWRVVETATGVAYTFTRRASAKSFWRVGCEHKMATTTQGWKYCVRCAGVLEQP